MTETVKKVDQDQATIEAAQIEAEPNSMSKRILMVKKVSNQDQDLEIETTLYQRIVSRRWTTRVPTRTCQLQRETQCREDKSNRTEDSKEMICLTLISHPSKSGEEDELEKLLGDDKWKYEKDRVENHASPNHSVTPITTRKD